MPVCPDKTVLAGPFDFSGAYDEAQCQKALRQKEAAQAELTRPHSEKFTLYGA
jgi:hypothetical protein